MKLAYNVLYRTDLQQLCDVYHKVTHILIIIIEMHTIKKMTAVFLHR